MNISVGRGLVVRSRLEAQRTAAPIDRKQRLIAPGDAVGHRHRRRRPSQSPSAPPLSSRPPRHGCCWSARAYCPLAFVTVTLRVWLAVGCRQTPTPRSHRHYWYRHRPGTHSLEPTGSLGTAAAIDRKQRLIGPAGDAISQDVAVGVRRRHRLNLPSGSRPRSRCSQKSAQA